MEEYQKYIQIIGGIIIFLPSNPTKASAHIVHAEGGQPTKTFMEGEKGETSSHSLEGRKDLNHALMVGKIRVSLGKSIGERDSDDVVCEEGDRQPIDSVILEERRREEEEHSI